MPDHDHDQTARDREVLKFTREWMDFPEWPEPIGLHLNRLHTLATEALELREEVGRAHEQIKVLTRGFNAAHEMQDEAIAALREENAQLAQELKQAREDAEVGRLLREMPSNWMFYWRGGRWHINIKVSTGLVPFNGYDTESLVNEARKILDKDSCWSEIVETRDANPGGEEDAR